MNRLRWKCRRGMLELDLLLNRFLDVGYTELNQSSQENFKLLLEYQDTELLALLMGQTTASDRAIADVIQHIQRCT
jgi:antitoxin CptB